MEVPVEEEVVGVGRAEWSGSGLVSIDFRSKRPFLRTLFGIVLPDGREWETCLTWSVVYQ